MLHSSEFRKTSNDDKHSKMLLTKRIKARIPKLVRASELTSEYLLKNGFNEPLLLEGSNEEIGIKVPDRNMKFKDIADVIGSNTSINLLEVESQNEVVGYNLGQWAQYLEGRSKDHKTLNLISLEVSATPLNAKVEAPSIVRSVDWIDLVWPLDKRAKGDYPKVQKYCLSGMKGSYTDFHIDFGGTSVWYHVLYGLKRFYFVAPTTDNLNLFIEWSCSSDQNIQFFGDLVAEGQCYYVDLEPGRTMLIPSGWIHAVHTPQDSLVFGGNFLHSSAIINQLQVFVIEQRTNVGKIYRSLTHSLTHSFTHSLTYLLTHSLLYRFPYFRQINFQLLCNTLPLLSKQLNITIPSMRETSEDDDEDAAQVVDMFYHLPIFKQLPYLIKACELWLLNSDQANLAIFEASAGAIGLAASAVVSQWWEVVSVLAKVVDSEHMNEYDELINKVRSTVTFDLLDDDLIGWFSSQYKKYGHSIPMTKTIKLVETKSTPASVVSAGNEGNEVGAEAKEGLVFRIPMKRKVPDSSSDAPSAGLKSSKNTPVIKIQNNQIVKPKQEQKEVAQPVDRPVYSTVENIDVDDNRRYGTRGKKLSASFLEGVTDISVEQQQVSELSPDGNDDFMDDDVDDTNFEVEEEEDEYDDDDDASNYEAKHKKSKQRSKTSVAAPASKPKPVKQTKKSTRDQLFSLINVKRK